MNNSSNINLIPPSSLLLQLVQSGKLDIIHVMGLPRSNGTALHLALTQAKEVSGQINEPLYFPDKARKWNHVVLPDEKIRSFDEGCSFILDRYKDAAQLTSGKVTLVVHNLSYQLMDDDFRKFLNLEKHIVFAIRDPRQVALSLFVRYVNDNLSEGGGDRVKTQDVLEFMNEDTDLSSFLLKNKEKFSTSMISQFVSKDNGEQVSSEDLKLARQKLISIFLDKFPMCWENLYHYYRVVKSEHPTHPHSVFDSSWLYNYPETHLRDLVERIKSITYTPDMIHNWTKGNKNQFRCIITRNWGKLAETNAWNGPVRNSTKIEPSKEKSSDTTTLESFPKEMRLVIGECDKLYREILLDFDISKRVG